MTSDAIILSMTTWPPREQSAIQTMRSLVGQSYDTQVHFVLALSLDEWDADHTRPWLANSDNIVKEMEDAGVEILWDENNIKSHKKLIPALEKYPDNPILVVDDDLQQQQGWLQTFIDDHRAHPSDIIYGNASSKVEIYAGKIFEGIRQRGMYTKPGKVTCNEKPANGAAGTLYPSGTFTDDRFFDRRLFMRLCPTSDETWQWAWGVMARKTYRCLSSHNIGMSIGADQDCALFKINITKYTQYHNAIAEVFPLYKEELARRILGN